MDVAGPAATTDVGVDEAMSRYAEGDDDAFRHLYAAVMPCLTRVLRQVLRDRARVPDLIQETVLRVHRARGTFLRGAPALPWILTIARRLVLDAHRRRPSREQGADPDRLDRLSHRAPVDGGPTGEQILLAKEVAARLGRAFDHLPEGQRAALRLVKSEGLSTAEAAAALGTTAAGVRLRTCKAYRRLRTALDERQPRRGPQRCQAPRLILGEQEPAVSATLSATSRRRSTP
jgi:RNA polymerase sigma-70 factor (ECF subfamily)